MLETGVVGFTLLVVGIGTVVRWLIVAGLLADSQQRKIIIAVGLGFAISLVHSLVDFVWYIPACMSFAIFLIAIIYASWQHLRFEKRVVGIPQASWVSVFGLIAIAATGAIVVLIKPVFCQLGLG